eukprot:1927664-Ditylum_brightwellii.AAC.1
MALLKPNCHPKRAIMTTVQHFREPMAGSHASVEIKGNENAKMPSVTVSASLLAKFIMSTMLRMPSKMCPPCCFVDAAAKMFHIVGNLLLSLTALVQCSMQSCPSDQMAAAAGGIGGA